MTERSSLLTALREAWKDPVVEQARAPQPRKSPHVEAMVEAVEAGLEGRIHLNMAVEAVRAMRQRLENARAELEENVQASKLTQAQESLCRRIRDAYELNAELLEELSEHVRRFRRDEARNSIRRLRGLTGDLYECLATWEAEMRETCDQSEGMLMVPAPYAAVYEACEKVARGQIDLEQWQRPIVDLRAEIAATCDAIEVGFGQISLKLKEDGLCNALAEAIQRGFLDSRAALDLMLEYMHARDVRFLNDGWTSLAAATLYVQKAIRRMSAGEQPYADSFQMDADD
jgi:hypothetical protein